MSLILMILASAAASQSIAVEHHGAWFHATYNARANVRSRTVGANTPNRMDSQRCRWTATIVVDRTLDRAPGLTRVIGEDKRYSGSEHGACHPKRQVGEKQLARHRGEIEVHLARAIAADRSALLAELDAVRNLASN